MGKVASEHSQEHAICLDFDVCFRKNYSDLQLRLLNTSMEEKKKKKENSHL